MNLNSVMYASKAVSAPDQIKSDLSDILAQSIKYNSVHKITGVLYYGNGYFLQYIEGPKDKLESLIFQSILRDARHKHCEILYYHQQEQALFESWSMKFAGINHNIRSFFQSRSIYDFNHYLLSTHCISPFIELLREEPCFNIHGYKQDLSQQDKS